MAAEQAELHLEAIKAQALSDRQLLAAAVAVASERLLAAQQDLAVERAAVVGLREEVKVWTGRSAEAQGQLREAQEMFTREVASLREALASAEARSAAAEQRALEMIEEERGRQRKLAARCTHAEQQAETQGRKAEALTAQVLALTSEASMLKGRMASWEEEPHVCWLRSSAWRLPRHRLKTCPGYGLGAGSQSIAASLEGGRWSRPGGRWI